MASAASQQALCSLPRLPCAVISTLLAFLWSASSSAAEFPTLRPLTPEDSVLVVSPHPDDESLCCGGLIHTARSIGARVAIVWVTYGDGFRWSAMVAERRVRPRQLTYRHLADRRAGEALTAASVLRVEESSLFFLGYPDRGVLELLLDYYYPDTPWRSRFTGASSVIYVGAVNPGSVYDGDNLERDFAGVLDRVQPTLVLAPSPQDTHPDHRGTGILVWRAMNARKEMHKTRFWIVHGGRGWPRPRAYRPDLPATAAPRGQGMQWEQFPLDAAAVAAKRQAVRSHRSQTKVMGRVMDSHVRASELYSPMPIPPGSACGRAEPCEFEDESVLEEAGL